MGHPMDAEIDRAIAAEQAERERARRARRDSEALASLVEIAHQRAADLGKAVRLVDTALGYVEDVRHGRYMDPKAIEMLAHAEARLNEGMQWIRQACERIPRSAEAEQNERGE